MIHFRPGRLFAFVPLVIGLVIAAAAGTNAQPVGAPTMALDELRAGMKGQVWTVFQGTTPEPFEVEVAGIVRNALGPGKSLILCQLTDPRVQLMGAVAGMSGSPLYIDGKLAGALSYQVQRFETVRYAGFTPVDDLLEVRRIAMNSGGRVGPGETTPVSAPAGSEPLAQTRASGGDSFQPLTPVFTLGGVAPTVAAAFSHQLQALGLSAANLGGSGTDPSTPAPASDGTLRPGEAVAAALAIGDITLAGTGTVSQVEGTRVLAFGHPMLGLGAVDVPMASAEIVAILPSNQSSMKISNTGPVIGTVRQDRLSAIYGELGPGPTMVPVTVTTPTRTLRFSTVRHHRLTPTIATLGLTQAVLGSNDAGLTEGFRVGSRVVFPDGREITHSAFFAGPQGFNAGLDGFIRRLTTWVQNPVEEVFPSQIFFEVEPLGGNPTGSLDIIQVSRRTARPGERVDVTLTMRDYQGRPVREIVSVDIPAAWTGKQLDVIIASGEELDRLEGVPDSYSVASIRTIDAYLDAIQRERRSDGLYVAVVERSAAFVDQTKATLDLPGSLERIARGSDENRFQKRDVQTALWQQHVFPGKLLPAIVRRPLAVIE
ncbi:SpoIVB peptidase S55 domain-containing protein [Opitutaceae bacterium]